MDLDTAIWMAILLCFAGATYSYATYLGSKNKE